MIRCKLIWIILPCVIAAHLAALALVAGSRVLPERERTPPANFGYAEGVLESADGELLHVREFTLSTRLAGAATPPAEPAEPTEQGDERGD